MNKFNKVLNKSLNIVLSITLIFVVFGQTLDVLAQTTNGNDIFYITSPQANQSVKGSISVSWRMYDDAQESIQYTAKVYDRETCETTNYGDITTTSNGLSSQTSDNVLIWDTRSTASTASLSDGFYCLQICVALTDNNIPYSSCNGREILIVNNNRSPVISSLPPSDNEILETESWQYQVNASDADNHTLSYRLSVKPSFLDINPSTGLISTNGLSKALASGIYRAEYRVVLEVKDIFNAVSYQEFTIVVYKPLPVTDPGSGGDNGEDDLDDNQKNEASEINILSPKSNSNLKDEALIKWDVKDSDGISSIDIEYSLDEKDWININTIKDSDTQSVGEYTWDISEIADDKYFLRFKVTDLQGSTTEEVVSNINIRNNDDITSNPLIYELRPENSSEINTLRPEISAKFIPSTGSSIDTESFSISLDDNDILDTCSLTTEGFICKLTQDLEIGKHKVLAKVSDTSDKSTEQEWFFDITEVLIPDDSEDQGNVVNIFGRTIPVATLITIVLICLLSILLLLIPWAIFLFIQNRRRNKTKVNIEIKNDLQPTPLPNLGNTPSVDEIENVFMPESKVSEPVVPQAEVKPVDINVDNYQEPTPVEENTNEVKQDVSTQGDKNIDISSFEEFLKQYPDLNTNSKVTPSEIVQDVPVTPVTEDIQPNVNVSINNTVEPSTPVVPEVNVVNTPEPITEVKDVVEPEVILPKEDNEIKPDVDVKDNSNITLDNSSSVDNDTEFVEPQITDTDVKPEQVVTQPSLIEASSTDNITNPSVSDTPVTPDVNISIENNVTEPVVNDVPTQIDSQEPLSPDSTIVKQEEDKVVSNDVKDTPTDDVPTIVPEVNETQNNDLVDPTNVNPVTFDTTNGSAHNTQDSTSPANSVNEEKVVNQDIDKKTLYSPISFDTDKNTEEKVDIKFNPNSSSWVDFYEEQNKLKDESSDKDSV